MKITTDKLNLSGYQNNIKLSFKEKIALNLNAFKIFFSNIHKFPSFLKIPKYNIQKKIKEKSVLEFCRNGVKEFTISEKHIKELKTLLSSKISSLILKVNAIKDTDRKFEDCVLGISKEDNENIYQELNKIIFSNYEIKSIIQNLIGLNGELKVFYIHYNQQSDVRVFRHGENDEVDKETNFYHVDNNMNTLKAMIYLDHVNEKNGPFEYVKGSFRKNQNFLVWCRRKVTRNLQLHNRDDRSKAKFNSLLSFFKIKHEFSELKKNSKEFDYIKKNAEIYKSPNNFIIFDPLGIHRGGLVYEGERLALQLVYSLDDDWKL